MLPAVQLAQIAPKDPLLQSDCSRQVLWLGSLAPVVSSPLQ
jgi:hypothetical protein